MSDGYGTRDGARSGRALAVDSTGPCGRGSSISGTAARSANRSRCAARGAGRTATRPTCAYSSATASTTGALPEKPGSPVQATGGNGLKLTLALLRERQDEMPEARPLPTVHDETVVEGGSARPKQRGIGRPRPSSAGGQAHGHGKDDHPRRADQVAEKACPPCVCPGEVVRLANEGVGSWPPIPPVLSSQSAQVDWVGDAATAWEWRESATWGNTGRREGCRRAFGSSAAWPNAWAARGDASARGGAAGSESSLWERLSASPRSWPRQAPARRQPHRRNGARSPKSSMPLTVQRAARRRV